LHAASYLEYVARMLRPEILSYDSRGDAVGDRFATPGWPVWGQVKLWKPEGWLVRNGQVVGTMRPQPIVLTQFLALADDPTDAAILAFARRCGLLGLAPLEPASRMSRSVESWIPWLPEVIGSSLGYRHAPAVEKEPLELWRRICREVKAVVEIGARLRADEPAERGLWAPLADVIRLPYTLEEAESLRDEAPWATATGRWVRASFTTLDGQRIGLAAVIGAWLALGSVRPVLSWEQPDPIVSLGTSSLFGGIVLELFAAIGGNAGMALCSSCGAAFIPHRRPSAKQMIGALAIYCAACRKGGVPRNRASRLWRERHPTYTRPR
jgi:hypothetical protein